MEKQITISKSKSRRHLKAIEDSHKMGLSQEFPIITKKLCKNENVTEDRKYQYKKDCNTYAIATGYAPPYPFI